MTRELPPAWRKVMEPKRLHSLRDLATAAGVSPSTASRLIHGERTSQETVDAVAAVLGISGAQVWEMHGKPRTAPFTLDPDADRLSPTQRAAIKAVIRAMLEGANTSDGTVVILSGHRHEPAKAARKVTTARKGSRTAREQDTAAEAGQPGPDDDSGQ